LVVIPEQLLRRESFAYAESFIFGFSVLGDRVRSLAALMRTPVDGAARRAFSPLDARGAAGQNWISHGARLG
jgi:hypothetical protein